MYLLAESMIDVRKWLQDVGRKQVPVSDARRVCTRGEVRLIRVMSRDLCRHLHVRTMQAHVQVAFNASAAVGLHMRAHILMSMHSVKI